MPRNDEAFLDWVLYSNAFLTGVNSMRTLRKRLSGEGAHAKPRGQIKTFGIKDFSPNFHRYGLADYLDKRLDIKVIGLIREDVVDRMISNAMLGATEGMAAIHERGTRKQPQIDRARIATVLSDIEHENAQLD